MLDWVWIRKQKPGTLRLIIESIEWIAKKKEEEEE